MRVAEYCGTDFQIAIQKRIRHRHAWISETPEVANGGRIMNFLEPDKTGWDRIRTFLEEDGAVAITAQDRGATPQRLYEMYGPGYEYPSWDTYTGKAADILVHCRELRHQNPMPEGWRVECLECPDDHALEAIQTLNTHTGVSPAPAYYLRSEVIPSLTSCIWTPDGGLAATATVSGRYHAESRFADYVFNGSISVDIHFRGKGLGKVVNAHVLIESQRRMGWAHGISQVAADNPASQKTVEACGFSRDPDLATYAVVQAGKVITR
jgi:hypothetical protein